MLKSVHGKHFQEKLPQYIKKYSALATINRVEVFIQLAVKRNYIMKGMI